MAQTLKKGDRVSWNTPQGKTTGKVDKKLTGATDIKGHMSPPRLKIRSIW
jgi:hypothetical protein